VYSSKPRLPGETRAKLILCLQVGHIGRLLTPLILCVPLAGIIACRELAVVNVDNYEQSLGRSSSGDGNGWHTIRVGLTGQLQTLACTASPHKSPPSEG
jgi:hypothetical protein